MKSIYFVTPTQMSFIDLITMGDSEKRGNSNTIGQFASGLKYSLALLLRNNVQFEAVVKGNTFIGGHDRDYTEIFTPYTYINEDAITGKSKELIGINVQRDFQSFNSIHCEDIFECKVDENYETGFALQLGFNWDLWMALREIYSNMLDEGGFYYEYENTRSANWVYNTTIKLTFEEGSEFDTIWQNRRNFIKEDNWTWELPNGIKVCENSDTWLKIYKNNILVHEDRDCQTNFSFCDDFADIDERRLINNKYATFSNIVSGFGLCNDKSLLRLIINNVVKVDDFLENRSTISDWQIVSEEVFEVIDDIVEQCGDFTTYSFLKSRVIKDDRYKHFGRTLNSLSSHLYSYSKDVVVGFTPTISEELKSKKDLIVDRYNLCLDGVIVKESTLSGRSCVADKLNNTIIISNTFDIDEHIPEFIVEYYALTSSENIIKVLSKELEKLLKK